MSLEHVLWIVGTAVAASTDDPRVAAATDGTRVWVTTDTGARWRLAMVHGRADEDLDDPATEDEPPPWERTDRPVRSLAILDDDLFIATRDGLYVVPVQGGRVSLRCALPFTALAVRDATLWAAAGGTLHRSDDRGRRWSAVIVLPSRDVRSLGVSGDRAIIASGWDAYLVELGGGASLALATGAVSVAASGDGSFWRASRATVERSTDGGETWRPAAAHGGVAVAVGAAQLWLATERMIDRATPPGTMGGPAEPPADRSGSARGGEELSAAPEPAAAPAYAAYVPTLTARMAVAERRASDASGGRETVVELWLRWELDRAVEEARP